MDEAVLADIQRQMPTFHYIGLNKEQIAKAFPAMVVVRVQADDGSKTLRVVVDMRTRLWFALEREDGEPKPST